MRRGRLVRRRNAHQPVDRETLADSRQRATKASASAGITPALLRLLAGIDLDEEPRPALRRGALAISLASASRQRGPVERVDGVEQRAPPRAPCSIAAGRSGAVRRPGSARAGPAIWPSPPARGSRRRRAARRREPARSPPPGRSSTPRPASPSRIAPDIARRAGDRGADRDRSRATISSEPPSRPCAEPRLRPPRRRRRR